MSTENGQLINKFASGAFRQSSLQWVHRGQIDSLDFAAAELEEDGAWHTLDLSDIIPVGTQHVQLKTYIFVVASVASLKVRTPDETNTNNVDVSAIPANGVPWYKTLWVTLNSDREIEYWLTSASYTGLYINVGGWYVEI